MRKVILVQVLASIDATSAKNEETLGNTREQPTKCEYELLLLAALRNPRLADYLKVEGIARVGSLPRTLVA